MDIRELLEQHAEQGKIQYVFPNRNLMLHPHIVNVEKDNRANKIQLQPAVSPESPASIREQTDSPQVAQKTKWLSVNSWPHSFPHSALNFSKSPAHSVRLCVMGHTSSESYQETGKHIALP